MQASESSGAPIWRSGVTAAGVRRRTAASTGCRYRASAIGVVACVQPPAMALPALHTIDDPQTLREIAWRLQAERDTARAQIQQQAWLIDARERTISHRDTQIAALTGVEPLTPFSLPRIEGGASILERCPVSGL